MWVGSIVDKCCVNNQRVMELFTEPPVLAYLALISEHYRYNVHLLFLSHQGAYVELPMTLHAIAVLTGLKPSDSLCTRCLLLHVWLCMSIC